jgi:hypothetical protein
MPGFGLLNREETWLNLPTRAPLLSSINAVIFRMKHHGGNLPVIKSVMHANDDLTFYVKYGDYIGRGAIVVTILLACFAFVQRFRKKKIDVPVTS